jgi:hypothetical protein
MSGRDPARLVRHPQDQEGRQAVPELVAPADRGDEDAQEPARPRARRRAHPLGQWARIVQRLLALNACIWFNWMTDVPVKRFLIAHDH